MGPSIPVMAKIQPLESQAPGMEDSIRDKHHEAYTTFKTHIFRIRIRIAPDI